MAADGVNRPLVGDGTALQAKLDAAETDDGKAAAALKEAEAQADAERTAAESKAGKGKK